MEDQFQKLDLSKDEEEELVFDVDDGENDVPPDLDLCLVGRFLTNQAYNFNIMRSRMASIWKPGKGVLFKDIGNERFLIQFFHILDLRRVVDGGPWSFDNHPLIIHNLQVGDIPTKVLLNKLLFWVQIHNIPHGLFTEKVGRSLGNFIGTFVQYDESNKGAAWKPYMRIRVELNVDNPLMRWKKIRMSNGNTAQVDFKYERLQIFCFICGKLGHSERFCEIPYTNSQDEIPRGWGVFLKAADRRSQALTGNRWLRQEAGIGGPVGGSGNSNGYSDMEGEINEERTQGRQLTNLSKPRKSANTEENDEIDLTDPKKRKRGLNVHGEGTSHEDAQTDTTATDHFLTAGPGFRGCRG